MPTGKLGCADDVCNIKCNADVDVLLKPKPNVRCHESSRRGTSFDFALETRLNPHCTITSKGSHRSKKDPCTNVCLFSVDIDADCDVKLVRGACGKSKLSYKVDVDIPVESECQIKNVCQDKPHHPKPGMAIKSAKPLTKKPLKETSGSNKYAEQLSRDAKSRSTSPALKFK